MLRVLCLYLKVAIFQPELREHAPHTTSVLKSCDLPAGAAGARSAYYVCTQKLRFASRSCRSTLRVLRLHLKAAIFKPELPRTRGESNPRPRDCESRRANHETTSKGRFASKKIARRHSESASTRTISAEGSSGSRQMRTAPQRERSDTHDLRRGLAATKTNSHGATARALRRAGSPQRVRQGQDKFARRHSESASTRRISAEGSPRPRQIRAAPQRERFDTHDLRRGFAALKTNSHGATARALRHARSPQKTNSHGATARALRHARSPQRVRRAQDKFARRRSESASTRTIFAEGSSGSRQICTGPQRERFDTHDLRRGVRFVSSRRAYPRHKKKKN